MRLEVGGIEYGDFVAASAILRLDALSNSFAFEATARDAVPLPFRGGERCRVLVDGEQVLDGFVELVNVRGDASSHAIDVQGRDKTADLLDSSLGPVSDLKAPITLAGVIRKVAAHLGSGTPRFGVVDEVGPPPFDRAIDELSPEPGQNAFEFVERLARKRQVLLTSDAEGNVVIARSSGVDVDANLRHRVGDSENNVLSYDVSYDLTGRFNLYRSLSQLNPLALGAAGTVGNESIVDQSGRAVDSLVRIGRQLVLVAESPLAASEDGNRATWERNVRRARGRVYSARVSGHRNQAGALWKPNTRVRVDDDFAGIAAKLLVNSVAFSLDVDGGRATTLSLVEPDAYTLALEEPEDQEIGDGLAF